MVNLKMKECKCPICGCNTVVTESIDVTRGYLEPSVKNVEKREFLCGFSYTSDYGRIVPNNKCYYDVTRNSKLKKVYDDKEKIRQFLADNDIDTSICNDIAFYVRDESNWQKEGKY